MRGRRHTTWLSAVALLAAGCAGILGMEEGEPYPANVGGGGSPGGSSPGGGGAAQGGAAGAGGGVECTSADDCKILETECWAPDCDNAICQVAPKLLLTACGPSGQHYCNGLGTCVECVDDSSTPCDVGAYCYNNLCVSPGCTNGLQDAGESDVDCGGSCPPCGDGMGCTDDYDCASLRCVSWSCTSCASQTECAPDLYCAIADGNCRPKKGIGQQCIAHYECITGECKWWSVLLVCQ